MKYLAFIRHSEAHREAGPPPALLEAMGRFVQKSLQDGSLVDTGGLLPTKDGFPRTARQGRDYGDRRSLHGKQGNDWRLGHSQGGLQGRGFAHCPGVHGTAPEALARI
jgi:hypothetical protein